MRDRGEQREQMMGPAQRFAGWASRRGAKFVAPALLIGFAAVLLAPAHTRAFEVFGDVLDLTQRDFRVFANFSGPFANTNTTPDPDFPGSVGAELAIRKGIAEWGSRAHGSGLTDPTQAVLGSGDSNFDAFFVGSTLDAAGPNGNVVSVIPGGGAGTFAFAELPIGDGWRIRFFDLSREWSDQPSGPAGTGTTGMDIQGVMCHEYGHALGLDHSHVPGATMGETTLDRGVDLRSIEQDDRDGLAFLYGPLDSNKPLIESYDFTQGGQLRIVGAGFDAAQNDVWFTPAVPASGDLGAPFIATGIASSGGGTRLVLDVPTGATAGDLAVRVPGSDSASLSNVLPFDPVRLPWSPPERYGTAGTSAAGTQVRIEWLSLPSATAGTVRLRVTGGSGPGFQTGVLAIGTERGALQTRYGELSIGGTLVRASLVSLFSGAGDATLDLSTFAPFEGSRLFATFWVPDSSPAGGAFSDALEITVTQ